MRRALQQPLSVSGVELDIHASVGISLFPFDASDAQTLLQHADAAMYQAKAAGRDACSVYHPGERDAQEQLELALRLRKAIAADELVLHYQPVVELRSGTMTGAEALIRWEDPDPRHDPPGRLHSPGRAHRPDPTDKRVGDRRGQPAGRGLAGRR